MNELALRNKALATIARMAVDALGADPEMLDSPVSLVGHLVKHLDRARSEVKRLESRCLHLEAQLAEALGKEDRP